MTFNLQEVLLTSSCCYFCSDLVTSQEDAEYAKNPLALLRFTIFFPQQKLKCMLHRAHWCHALYCRARLSCARYCCAHYCRPHPALSFPLRTAAKRSYVSLGASGGGGVVLCRFTTPLSSCLPLPPPSPAVIWALIFCTKCEFNKFQLQLPGLKTMKGILKSCTDNFVIK